MALRLWAPRHKFKAKPAYDGDIRFGSTLERDYWLHLNLLMKTGEVVFVLRQVPFHLPGGVKYVCDFQELRADGSVVFTDTKGVVTKDFIMKKKMVEDLYPVIINVVKRKDF